MIRYIITGEEERGRGGRYIIPRDATHVSVHPSVTVIPSNLFYKHPNIVELICHDGVIKIEWNAFRYCPRLKRVIMRGVRVVENAAFEDCEALQYVECPKLEIIGGCAFDGCKSLSDINLPSAKEVEDAFGGCEALAEAKFGKELESLEDVAFFRCPSLERITIPLKNGLITDDGIFIECANLKRVDLVEKAVLHETVTALVLEGWRDDMNREIDSINHILPNAPAGEYKKDDVDDDGEKAITIREWIRRVLRKIISYKAQHRRLLNKAASALQRALPNDIVTNHVVPFLELPFHTFDGEDEEESMDDSDDGSEDTSDEDAGEEEDVSANGGDDEEQQQQEWRREEEEKDG